MNPTTASLDISALVAQLTGTLSSVALLVPFIGLAIVGLVAFFLTRD